jgi:ligand-binding SRPBCC domain-containing protein
LWLRGCLNMKLTIKTRVNQSYSQVWAGFDKTLFDQLAPPFPPVRVARFDGCLAGHVVDLELNFLLFKQRWVSHITEQQTTDTEIYFIDEGRKLPFFLSYWQHRHRIVKAENSSIIADEIVFKTPFGLFTDYLFYPLLWLQFVYRKPIYRRVFA